MGRSELERLLDKGDVAKDLGVEFAELNPERVVVTMPIDRRHLQPFGYLHGGQRHLGRVGGQHRCLPELPAGGRLTVVGIPVHAGRRSQVWEVRIEDEDGKPVCASRCSVAIVDLEA